MLAAIRARIPSTSCILFQKQGSLKKQHCIITGDGTNVRTATAPFSIATRTNRKVHSRAYGVGDMIDSYYDRTIYMSSLFHRAKPGWMKESKPLKLGDSKNDFSNFDAVLAKDSAKKNVQWTTDFFAQDSGSSVYFAYNICGARGKPG